MQLCRISVDLTIVSRPERTNSGISSSRGRVVGRPFNYFYVNVAGGIRGLLMQFRGTNNVANPWGFGDTSSHNVPNMRAF